MRRNGFELKMQDRYSHFLAADTDAEMEEWVATLRQALQGSTEASQDRRNGAEALDCGLGESRSMTVRAALAMIARFTVVQRQRCLERSTREGVLTSYALWRYLGNTAV